MPNATPKVCSKCKQAKPATPEHFARNRTKPDGLQGECKPCRKKIVTPQLKAYRAEAEKTAKNKGTEWTIDELVIARDRKLTIAAAAKQLGRSFNAVAKMRKHA